MHTYSMYVHIISDIRGNVHMFTNYNLNIVPLEHEYINKLCNDVGGYFLEQAIYFDAFVWGPLPTVRCPLTTVNYTLKEEGLLWPLEGPVTWYTFIFGNMGTNTFIFLCINYSEKCWILFSSVTFVCCFRSPMLIQKWVKELLFPLRLTFKSKQIPQCALVFQNVFGKLCVQYVAALYIYYCHLARTHAMFFAAGSIGG